ncbi:hypothetical protein GEMRC1_007707 [Eukaryota sp. GEM-RC1]
MEPKRRTKFDIKAVPFQPKHKFKLQAPEFIPKSKRSDESPVPGSGVLGPEIEITQEKVSPPQELHLTPSPEAQPTGPPTAPLLDEVANYPWTLMSERDRRQITKSAMVYSLREEKKKKTLDPVLQRVKESRGLLNKLSAENFNEVSNQLCELVNLRTVHISGLTEEQFHEFVSQFLSALYSKAILEPTFNTLYANLMIQMAKVYPPLKQKLIHICQSAFTAAFEDEGGATWTVGEQEVEDKIKLEMTAKQQSLDSVTQARRDVELFYMQRRVRAKVLGNVDFIAKLCTIGQPPLLSPAVVFLVTSTLLKNAREYHDNNSVEALTILFTNVGRIFSTNPYTKQRLDEIISNEVYHLIEDPNLEKRVKFLCLDLYDLWKNNWIQPGRVLTKEVVPGVTEDEEGFRPVPIRKARPAYTKRSMGDRFDLAHAPVVNPFEGLEEDAASISSAVDEDELDELDEKAKRFFQIFKN